MHDTIPLLHIDLHYKLQSGSILAEPTRGPRELKILTAMTTCAELSWKHIPCCQQHGTIRHYLIVYEHTLPTGITVQQQSKTTGNVLKVLLLNLRPNTDYVVRVAGVNRAGRGASSPPLDLTTDSGKKMGLFKSDPCCFINAVLFCTL